MRDGAVFNRKRLAGLCLTTILCTGLAAPAAAQTAHQYRSLDANGVDLTHGDQLVGISEGSIGAGDAEISLVRKAVSTGSGSAHVGYGPHQWDGIFLERVPVLGGSPKTVIYNGGRFETFSTNGTLPSGSSLTGSGSTYFYRTADGTLVTFSDPSGQGDGVSTFCNEDPAQTACVLPPSSIAAPGGKSVLLEWDLFRACRRPGSPEDPQDCAYWARLANVSNNSGYRIAFAYASGGSGGFGTAPPPSSWKQRTSAAFYNDSVGGAAVASTSYSYPSTGVVDVTDTAGRAWRFTGDTTKITAIRRPGAASDTTSYTFSGDVVTSVTRDGVTTGYSRSVAGSTATMVVTNALSQVSTVVSDLNIGRPTSITNALSQTTGYQYDSSGRLTETTLPEGNKAVIAYDARGNVTSTTLKAKPGSGLADIVTTAGYPVTCSNPVTCNSPDWTKDAKGNQTDYTYDPTHGGVLTVTTPADSNGVRPQTRYSYTLTSGVYLLTGTSACQFAASCAGSASESKTAITYGGNRLPTTITASAGDGSISATTTTTYDAVGNIKTIDGPLAGAGDTTTYRYDSGRRQTGVIGPDPDGGGTRKPTAQRMTYGNDGLTLKETGYVDDASDPSWATFSSQEQVAVGYDAYARPIKTELKSGGTVYAVAQTSYDGLGRVDCTVQRMNSATFGSLPASACTLATTGSSGPDRVAKTIYDAAGRITKVQSALGTAQQADEVTTAYSSNGQSDYVIDAENNRTEYSYDGHDRLVKTEYPSTTKGANAPNAADYEQLGYDANGNVTSRRLRDGQTIGYTYDNLNRVTFYDQPVAGAYWDLAYEYDLFGRLKKATGNGWAINAFTYDALGRLTVEQNYNTTTYHAYDVAGRQTRLTWHDGFYVDYDFDMTGNVTAIRENGATSGVGVLATYGYDNLGRRTSLTRGNGMVTTYSFDGVSRLSSLTQDLAGVGQDLALGFSYNAASQVTSNTRSNDAYAWGQHYNVDRPYTANGLNQLTAAGANVLGYDARGNLTTSGSTSYGYTVENRLTTGPNGLTLIYELTGNRLLGTYNGSTGADTRFGWSGDQMITEISASPWQVLRRYVPGPGVDERVVWYEGSGTSDRRWLHADERGSIVSVTNSAGATININSYDEYGIPAAGNIGRFGYTGQAWIPELGMWYYKARVYSPTLGRFMQTDPTGYDDGMNWYNYVGSDPLNATDPSGTVGLDNAPIDSGLSRLGLEWESTANRLRTHSYDGLASAFSGMITFNGGRIENAEFERIQRIIASLDKLIAYENMRKSFASSGQTISNISTDNEGYELLAMGRLTFGGGGSAMVVRDAGIYDLKIITETKFFVQQRDNRFSIPIPIGQLGAFYFDGIGNRHPLGTIVVRTMAETITRFPSLGSRGVSLRIFPVVNTPRDTSVMVFGKWKGK